MHLDVAVLIKYRLIVNVTKCAAAFMHLFIHKILKILVFLVKFLMLQIRKLVGKKCCDSHIQSLPFLGQKGKGWARYRGWGVKIDRAMDRLERLYLKKQHQVGFPHPVPGAVWLSRKESVSFLQNGL